MRRSSHILLMLLTACGGGEVREDKSGVAADDTGDGGGGQGGDLGDGPVDADNDGYPSTDDCDDNNPDVNPGTVEVCNGIDDDCDGVTDRDASRQPSWYPDDDADGYGQDTTPIRACDAPDGHVAVAGDCDAGDARVNPGATDDPCTFPGQDLDCSGVVDETDGDGDGFLDCEDCDDAEASIYPGADERCNGVDDDCDGVLDESDAVDATDWFADGDGDGFGVADMTQWGCDPGTGWADRAGDCDDVDPDENPEADEICDGDDDDCDGFIDEEDAVGQPSWFADDDGDGYGDPAVETVACDAPSGTVADNTDCDDREWWTHPGATEICGGGDEDCDGLSDDDDPGISNQSTWFADTDGDTFGDPAVAQDACRQPSGHVSDDTDCDDGDATTHPGADEVCDGDDDDCDGTVDESDAVDAPDWYRDSDGDGYGLTSAVLASCTQPSGHVSLDGDCDDGVAAVNPGATEIWYDGTDGDCSGGSDHDADGDGFDHDGYGGTDCDDTNPLVKPGATEIWYDGTDGDCDGASDYDADADGYDSDAYGGLDCDDSTDTISPGVAEVWYDGVDANCDGWSDDDADLDGFEADVMGGDDCDDTDEAVHPYAWEDDTNGVDDDCDGDMDTADDDVVYDLGLDGTDDASAEVTVTGVSFPFCGASYSTFFVSTNGIINFGTAYGDYLESGTGLTTTEAPAIAALWDDLATYLSGDVYGIVYDDAVGIYYRRVRELAGSNQMTFSVVMRDDGRILWDFGSLGLTDGLVGWACASGTVSTVDFSEAYATHPLGTVGVGQGTEGAVYEVFSTSNPNDLESWVIHGCGTAGTDSDGDGWTDVCGDPDDGDASVVP